MNRWAFIVYIVLFSLAGGHVYAQTLTAEQRAALQAEYDQLQTEIASWQKILDDTKAKKNTLTGDVTALNAQIAKAQKEIKQRSITITTLGSEINQKTAAIKTLEQRLVAGQEALAKLMRQKNEAEQRPLAILALSADDLSSFFSDVQNIDTIDAELQNLFATLRGVKTETQKEKEALNDRKNAELDARHEVVVKQTQIKENQTEKQKLLDITKKEEGAYQQVLAERQQIDAAVAPLREVADRQPCQQEGASAANGVHTAPPAPSRDWAARVRRRITSVAPSRMPGSRSRRTSTCWSIRASLMRR